MSQEDKNQSLSGTPKAEDQFQRTARKYEEELLKAEEEVDRLWEESKTQKQKSDTQKLSVSMKLTKADMKKLDKRFGEGTYITQNIPEIVMLESDDNREYYTIMTGAGPVSMTAEELADYHNQLKNGREITEEDRQRFLEEVHEICGEYADKK